MANLTEMAAEIARLRDIAKQSAENLLTLKAQLHLEIAERRRIEEALQESEESYRNLVENVELRNSLSRQITHDFNNLLATIMGNIDLAKIYIGQEAKVTEKLNRCEKTVERAKELALQLQNLARAGGAPVI